MQSWKDNLEEKLSSTPKYEEVSAACDELDQFSEPDQPEGVEDIEIIYYEMVPTRKKQSVSRQTRLSNAIAVLEAAASACSDALAMEDGDLPEDFDRDNVQSFIDELEREAGNLENVSFPGMFG